MLLEQSALEAIAAGRIDVVYRRWLRPTVRRGGTLRTQIGLLDIVEVDVVDDAAITDGDAVRAGYANASEVRAFLAARPDEDGRPRRTYRIVVRPGGADPRSALQQHSELDADELAALRRRLERLDRAAPQPWTLATLRAIEAQPEVRAVELAAGLGRQRDPFKVDVRKLKNLGLTISLERGYRLSPRGEALLAALGDAE